jgi:hypothetical protein
MKVNVEVARHRSRESLLGLEHCLLAHALNVVHLHSSYKPSQNAKSSKFFVVRSRKIIKYAGIICV